MGEMNWIELGNQTLLQRQTFNNLNSVQPLARAAKIYEAHLKDIILKLKVLENNHGIFI